MIRCDGRQNDELRTLEFKTNILHNAKGSVLVSFGLTQVICSAMIEEGVPPFLAGTGRGWLTAEYAMLPAATPTRKKRDRGKTDGRSVEIQRLIGRSLRGICDFAAMGEYTVHIDCDVISADGGTRTASISGAFLALALCVDRAIKEGLIKKSPIKSCIAAVSAGLVQEEGLLDLCYQEDSNAQADMNMVADAEGNIAEVQVCGEKRTISEEEFFQLMKLCKKGILEIIREQKRLLEKEQIQL